MSPVEMKRKAGRREEPPTRAAILDATQALMVEQGYAAVSTRAVAAAAGVKPSLVQHYFPKMDDLLLTVYRRAAERSIERQAAAVASDDPLNALWALSLDSSRTTLAVEFMALANHRKVIRAEIAIFARRSRAIQAEAIAGLLANGADPGGANPADGVALLLVGAARALVMEEALGFTDGHDAARRIVQRLIATVGAPGSEG